MERKLDDWIDSYLEYTSNTEPSELYRRWVAISTLAAALRRKVKVEWGLLTWYPNMYIVLVGPAAARKGTAMDPGLDLLRETDIPLGSDSGSREALIEKMKLAIDIDSDNPNIIPVPHHSLTVYSKELTNRS